MWADIHNVNISKRDNVAQGVWFYAVRNLSTGIVCQTPQRPCKAPQGGVRSKRFLYGILCGRRIRWPFNELICFIRDLVRPWMAISCQGLGRTEHGEVWVGLVTTLTRA